MKVLRIFTALLLIFLLLNYYSRKSLPFAYADVADYNLLYTSNDNIYVKKLEVINDSLDILFGGAVKEVNNYSVLRRSTKKTADTGITLYTGKSLRYKHENSQVIAVRLNDDTSSYSFNVSYTPRKTYQQAGNSAILEYEVTSADIAIEPAMVHEVSDWYPDDWLKDERIPLPTVQKFLLDSAGIVETDNTVQKILKIGLVVLRNMPDVKGLPSDNVSAMHPLQQLSEARAGRTKLWCGNFTAIFGSLASAAGIPYRTVFTGRSKNNLALGNHAFCEAWLKEEKRWVYVDLTNKSILLKQGDRYLNTIDVQRLLNFPAIADSINCYTVEGDSIGIVPYSLKSKGARYYFHQNTIYTFFYKDYFSNYSKAGYLRRIKNLFITSPQQAVYSDNLPGRNYHFLARVISNYLMVIMAALWLITFLAWLGSKLKKRK